MARVSFSSLIESITGKLAGSVFQNSFGGYQVRTRVSPVNRQTSFQQSRRGEFAWITGLWRSLTADQRQSFTDAAATPSDGFNLYVSANINASLIDAPFITEYIPSPIPDEFPILITRLGPSIFKIIANSALQIVPAGCTLLIYTTPSREQTKVFTNPSEFAIIATFTAGFYFSDPVDITAYFFDRFPTLTLGNEVYLKSLLINAANGLRGLESITSAIVSNPS